MRAGISPSKAKRTRKAAEPTSAMLVRAVPDALRLAFRAKALADGTTMRDRLMQLMRDYVNQKEK